MRRVHDAGVFEVAASTPSPSPATRSTYRGRAAAHHTAVEPWAFWPTLGDLDIHLIGEGRHDRLWTVLGASARAHQGTDGTAFAVWAPAAQAVRVVGDWNGWDGRVHPMRALGASGRVGDLRARGRAGAPLQVRGRGRRRRDPAQGRPAGPGDRAAAGQRQRRLPLDVRVGRRRLDGAPGRVPPVGRADVGLRGPPRVVDAPPRRPQPRLPRAGGAAGRPRRRPRLHPRRAAAAHRAPLRAVVGLPGDRATSPPPPATATPTGSATWSTTCTGGASG